MHDETQHPLDAETLAVFSAKGRDASGSAEDGVNENAVKVRRVMQMLRDVARPDGAPLRLLDLGCGEGVYSIEAALRGIEVLAVDGRTQRMEAGARAAGRLGLANLRFEQVDIRRLSPASHGQFDVVLALGILYHFDVPDLFHVVETIHAMCRRMVIIDTHVSLIPTVSLEHRGQPYEGSYYREHEEADPDPVRRSRVVASMDNPRSVWLTKKSLLELLRATGFTSILECHVPTETSKPEGRLTLLAMKGVPVRISAYPWLNGMSEREVEATLRRIGRATASEARTTGATVKERLGRAVNLMLRPLGCRIVRI